MGKRREYIKESKLERERESTVKILITFFLTLLLFCQNRKITNKWTKSHLTSQLINQQ